MEEFSDLSETLNQMLIKFINFLPSLVVALIVFIVGLYFAGLISRLVRRGLERRKTNTEVSMLVAKITRWSVIILVTMAALQQVEFNVTAFLTALGIGGF